MRNSRNTLSTLASEQQSASNIEDKSSSGSFELPSADTKLCEFFIKNLEIELNAELKNSHGDSPIKINYGLHDEAIWIDHPDTEIRNLIKQKIAAYFANVNVIKDEPSATGFFIDRALFMAKLNELPGENKPAPLAPKNEALSSEEKQLQQFKEEMKKEIDKQIKELERATSRILEFTLEDDEQNDEQKEDVFAELIKNLKIVAEDKEVLAECAIAEKNRGELVEEEQYLIQQATPILTHFDSVIRTPVAKVLAHFKKELIRKIEDRLEGGYSLPNDSQEDTLKPLFEKVKELLAHIAPYVDAREIDDITTLRKSDHTLTELGCVLVDHCFKLAEKYSEDQFMQRIDEMLRFLSHSLKNLDTKLPQHLYDFLIEEVKEILCLKHINSLAEPFTSADIIAEIEKYLPLPDIRKSDLQKNMDKIVANLILAQQEHFVFQFTKIKQALDERRQKGEDASDLVAQMIQLANGKLTEMRRFAKKARGLIAGNELQGRVNAFVEQQQFLVLLALKGRSDMPREAAFRLYRNKNPKKAEEKDSLDFARAAKDYQRDVYYLQQEAVYTHVLNRQESYWGIEFTRLLDQYVLALREMYSVLSIQKDLIEPAQIQQGLLNIYSAENTLKQCIQPLDAFMRDLPFSAATVTGDHRTTHAIVERFSAWRVQAENAVAAEERAVAAIAHYEKKATPDIEFAFEKFLREYRADLRDCSNPLLSLDSQKTQILEHIRVWAVTHGLRREHLVNLLSEYSKRIFLCELQTVEEVLQETLNAVQTNKQSDFTRNLALKSLAQHSWTITPDMQVMLSPDDTKVIALHNVPMDFVRAEVSKANARLHQLFNRPVAVQEQKAAVVDAAVKAKRQLVEPPKIDKQKIHVNLNWGNTTVKGGIANNILSTVLMSFELTLKDDFPGATLNHFYQVCASHPELFSPLHFPSPTPRMLNDLYDLLTVECGPLLNTFFNHQQNLHGEVLSEEEKKNQMIGFVYAMFALLASAQSSDQLSEQYKVARDPLAKSEAKKAAWQKIASIIQQVDLTKVSSQFEFTHVHRIHARSKLESDPYFAHLMTHHLQLVDSPGLTDLMQWSKDSQDVSLSLHSNGHESFSSSYQHIIDVRIKNAACFDSSVGMNFDGTEENSKLVQVVVELMEERLKYGAYAGCHVIVDDNPKDVLVPMVLQCLSDRATDQIDERSISRKMATLGQFGGLSLTDPQNQNNIIAELRKKEMYEKRIIDAFYNRHPDLSLQTIQEKMDDAFKAAKEIEWKGILADPENKNRHFEKIKMEIKRFRVEGLQNKPKKSYGKLYEKLVEGTRFFAHTARKKPLPVSAKEASPAPMRKSQRIIG